MRRVTSSTPPLTEAFAVARAHQAAWTAGSLLWHLRGEPLLATWRYGLGQAAAFTSDGLEHLFRGHALALDRHDSRPSARPRPSMMAPTIVTRLKAAGVTTIVPFTGAASVQAVMEAAEKNEKARLLMTQPGVGPITSLAFVLTMGDVKRFQRGKQVASYLGPITREYSSGGHQRLSGRKPGRRIAARCRTAERHSAICRR